MVVDMQKGSEEESIIRWLLTCRKEVKREHYQVVVDLQKGSEEESIMRWLLTCRREGNGGTVLGVLVLTTVSQTTLALSKGLVSVVCSCEGKSW